MISLTIIMITIMVEFVVFGLYLSFKEVEMEELERERRKEFETHLRTTFRQSSG